MCTSGKTPDVHAPQKKDYLAFDKALREFENLDIIKFDEKA